MVPSPSAPPVIALGGGITMAGVMSVLRRCGIQFYALCPESDFVRSSRWYRPLELQHADPRPEQLEAILETLSLPDAVLLPCSDDWLRAVAALPSRIAARFPSSTPGLHNVETMVDKWKFSQLLSSLRIPHPQTRILSSAAEFDQLADVEGAILKPLSSVEFAAKYGVKGYIAETREQARSLLPRLEFPILVQEFIPGPPDAGYFLDGFRDRKGEIKALFARRRLRMFPPRLGNSTFVSSVPLDELESAVFSLEYLLDQIKYRGIFSAEFKRDPRDQTCKLIEINARPWWYVEFAARCGVDVCSMAYRDALELPVDADTRYDVGRTCVFAPNDFRSLRDAAAESRSRWWSLVRNWWRADGIAFHWNDPGPALSYLRQSVTDYLQSRLGRSCKPNPAPAVRLAHR
jgi:predicted ATP-grasp superfamily ATP-dependent carboligase